jgi:hypothetical protein
LNDWARVVGDDRIRFLSCFSFSQGNFGYILYVLWRISREGGRSPMKRCIMTTGVGLLFGLASLANAQAQVDDREVKITSRSPTSSCTPNQAQVDDRKTKVKDVPAKRKELICFIWGNSGFPAHKLPSSIEKGVKSPVRSLENLAQVDAIHVKMDKNEKGVPEEGLAYLFVAGHAKNKNKLVVVHHGHDCTLDDNPDPLLDTGPGVGLQRTIKGLLVEGYSVLAVFMPRNLFNTATYNGCAGDHDSAQHSIMLHGIHPLDGSSPMKFFLEPVAVYLNYLEQNYSYSEFDMVGISGGGWTTTVYSAIDPRIRFSFPVAGSVPLYLSPGCRDNCDPKSNPPSFPRAEQDWPEFYNKAGYPDLYVMGSYGQHRKQVQILNSQDMTYGKVGVNDLRSYESDVRQKLHDLGGGGSFRLEIDDAPQAPEAHTISHNSVVNIILAELDGHSRDQSASDRSGTDRFKRGVNGNLMWLRGGTGVWQEIKPQIPMIGVPAVVKVERGVNKIDVFVRDPKNNLRHVYLRGTEWAEELPPFNDPNEERLIITDPVACSWRSKWIDVAAGDTHYTITHWRWDDGKFLQSEVVKNEQMDQIHALGPVSIKSNTANVLDLYFDGPNRAHYHMQTNNGKNPWKRLDLPGSVSMR